MLTSVFSPSPPRVIENVLQTRTYIYGQSSNVLVLDSPFEETRLILTNNLRTEGSYSNLFTVSASNEYFQIQRDNVVLARFDNKELVPRLIVPDGQVVANRFISSAPSDSNARKALVFNDFNKDSLHQFAGLGFSAGIQNYQVPIANAQHVFYAGFDPTSSLELMRIGSKDDVTQVGIGTTLVRNGVSLDVEGGVHIAHDLTVDGNLRIIGAVDFSLVEGVPTLDPTTQKLASSVMPSNVLFLDHENKVDASFLPSIYSGPYIRGLRNVGIGTRTPIQKLHVVGTTVTSERLGVGTNRPAARLHINDSNITAPSFRIDKPLGDGGDAIIVYGPQNKIAFNVCANGSVGIGVYNNSVDFPLRVAGGIQIDGKIALDNIKVANFEWKNVSTNTTYITGVQTTLGDGTFEPAIQAHVPFRATRSIITPEISFGGAPSNVEILGPQIRFASSGIRVEGDSVFEGSVHASNVHVIGRAIFETPISTLSDARIKCNLKRVQSPLTALEKIHGYTYTYVKNLAAGAASPGAGELSAGLLAQEVQRGFPTAVTHLNDGRLAVQYDSVLALLIEGFHELKRSVKALETKIDRMR